MDYNIGPIVEKSGKIRKISPDGTDVVLSSGLDYPVWLTFDAQDTLYVFDPDGNLFATDGIAGGPISNLNQISADGKTVTPIVSGLNNPRGIIFAPVLSATATATATAVPEPITLVSTLIGGTAALHMRKKLKANS